MIAPGCLVLPHRLPLPPPPLLAVPPLPCCWSWLAVAAQCCLRRQNDVKISKFRVLGQQIACDYRYSRLINVVEQTATGRQGGSARAWLRMYRKHHRMQRQAFCSFLASAWLENFPHWMKPASGWAGALVCFACLSFQLSDGTVRKQLKCMANRTNKQTNKHAYYMQFPIPPPTPQTSGNYNKVEKRRAVRASRREEVGEIFVFCFYFFFLGSSRFSCSFFSAGSNCCCLSMPKVHLKALPPSAPPVRPSLC